MDEKGNMMGDPHQQQMNAAMAGSYMMMGQPGAVMQPIKMPPAPQQRMAGYVPSGRGGGGTATGRFKKAPDAPKRFKSAFIIFSAEKHKEIKEKHAKEGRTEKTTDIAKLVSEAWRELPPEEKEVWEEKARRDKARYEVEKAMYKGPWKIPASKRTPKDPNAPKRPMSAFLAFSNKRRAGLKRQNPNATNADLSKMLSKQWKESPDELRNKYMEEEAELRAKYKEEMGNWRKRVSEEKKAERQEREAMAMQAAEARAKNPELAAQMMQQMGTIGGDQSGDGQDQNAQGGMFQYGMAGQGGEPGQPGFNPLLASQGPFAAQLGMQFQLQQLLANQQFLQQRGALGLYGQGLPNQGGQQGGQNQNAPGMQQNPNLAGFGSNNMEQGGQQQQQQDGNMQGFNGQQQQQGGGGDGNMDPNLMNQQMGGYGAPAPGQQQM